jgi:hypothetical protein
LSTSARIVGTPRTSKPMTFLPPLASAFVNRLPIKPVEPVTRNEPCIYRSLCVIWALFKGLERAAIFVRLRPGPLRARPSAHGLLLSLRTFCSFHSLIRLPQRRRHIVDLIIAYAGKKRQRYYAPGCLFSFGKWSIHVASEI